jgi:predicted GTPase
MKKTKVIIMGAAGRDFHNFNVYFRNNPSYEVVAFTATQIPGIAERKYPRELTGKLYPTGIPIFPEEQLSELIKKYNVDEVVFSYSDVSHEYVMHRASIVLTNGADFRLMGPKSTMLKSKKPVIAVCATRTGAGKSTVSRKVAEILRKTGYKVGIVRHPMPYGDLRKQICQRFASYDDLIKQKCTVEEQEEYNQHIEKGFVVFAGVDYQKILEEVEKEFQIILFDGGNNDLAFFKPDLHIVVVDPLRVGDELKYHPGEANVRMANIVIINKVNTAKPRDVKILERNIRMLNPKVTIIKAASIISVDKPELIKGKNVLCIEDGPSVTHGNIPYGVAFIAAKKFKARKIVSPKPYVSGSIKKAYEQYPHLKNVLPALGYGDKQMKELEKTIKNVDCDTVILGTPADLTRIMNIDKPTVRVSFELKELTKPSLEEIITKRLHQFFSKS